MFDCVICDGSTSGVPENYQCATPCGHVFHQKCLEKWLKRSPTCPHCRSEVSNDNIVKLYLHSDPQNVSNNNKATENDNASSLKNQLNQALTKEKQHLSTIINLKRNLELTKIQLEQKTRNENLNENLHTYNLPLQWKLKSDINFNKVKLQYERNRLKIGAPKLNLNDFDQNFLDGCIFYFVTNSARRSYGDKCLEYGGKFVEYFADGVTHLICSDQTFIPIAQDSIKSIKCASEAWIDDVLAIKKLLPPWLFHHFPTSYRRNAMPFPKNAKIAITNYNSCETKIVTAMLRSLGVIACYTLSMDIYVVLCPNLEGPVVEKAIAMNLNLISTQWLVDVYFGLHDCYDTEKIEKHQQFYSLNQFQMNYALIPPHLIHAWGIELIDLTDCDDGPSEPKRQKTGAVNINIENNGTYNNSNLPLVMFSGFSLEEENKYKMYVQRLGGKITEDNKGTHLVMKKPSRTTKFLLCLSSVTYIINESWLIDSYNYSRFFDEQIYCVRFVYDETDSVVCDVPKILKIPNRQDLFKGLSFYVCPTVKSLPPSIVEEIIISAGGVIEQEVSDPNNTFVHVTDRMISVLNLENGIVINKTDFILHSIMEQRPILPGNSN